MKYILPVLLVIAMASCRKAVPQQEQSVNDEPVIQHDQDLIPEGGFNFNERVSKSTKEAYDKEVEYRRNPRPPKGPKDPRPKDSDNDTVVDSLDNCVFTYNPNQEDSDGDGFGDACDNFTDADNDGVEDGIDNCLNKYNPQQLDCNRNGIGDECDPNPCTPSTEYEHVVFLDFDGDYVTSPFWTPYTAGQPFYVRSSGLADAEIAKVVERVRYDYRMFKVTITTDSTVYERAAVYKRQKVVVTQDNEWYGVAGGVAYIGSMFTFANTTPAFVFSKLLSYNWFYIAGASSHEAGHTIFLRHQIDIDLPTCTLRGSYRPGVTMGNPYYTVNTTQTYGWTIGPSNVRDSSAQCFWKVQNDEGVISTRIPYQ